VVFFAALPRTRTLPQRQLLEALCWGVLNAGNWSIFGAMQSDIFGTRPELYSRIDARDRLFLNGCGIIGIPLGVPLRLAGSVALSLQKYRHRFS
jgi:hypothetical protein